MFINRKFILGVLMVSGVTVNTSPESLQLRLAESLGRDVQQTVAEIAGANAAVVFAEAKEGAVASVDL